MKNFLVVLVAMLSLFGCCFRFRRGIEPYVDAGGHDRNGWR